MSNSPVDIKNKITNGSAEAFEELYIQLRKKEQRLYTDEQVRNLPEIDSSHPHFKEWLLRKKSSDRLIRYLAKKNKTLQVLEVGCGNGWLASQIARNITGDVVGIDINKAELNQAAAVFGNVSNLRFVEGDIRTTKSSPGSFDIIVFAASLQYFPSLNELMRSVFQFLREGGEVHIIDTIFYKKNMVNAAKQRTREYYTKLGFPEAAVYYYHHCIEDLEGFPVKILHSPFSWKEKFSKNKTPFSWVCIKKPGMLESNS